ncbi:hypothetical protein SCAR479_04138 [Seiridium cardinale]|uniref:Pectate lyase superfamily protein domain-containing protein n=1 Tax=Seiridium cardinale TaxID=138064 RepID=A0ABR2XYR3_9PEZI
MMRVSYLYLVESVLAVVRCTFAATVDWTTISNDRGDRLPDFSFCGYHASNEPLPSTSVAPSVILSPAGGDQTSDIQSALDNIAISGGGVVKLDQGTFHISSGLTVPSNTILRGSGTASTELSVIKQTAGIPLISLGNGTTHRAPPLVTSGILNKYVGIGASTMTVQDAGGFQVGQEVFISRAATEEWIRYNGMANLIRDNTPQTWISVGTIISEPRTIKYINGNNVTLTIPLTDALDRRYMEPYLASFSRPPTSKEIGLENLSITLSPTCSGAVVNNNADPCSDSAISISSWTVDSFSNASRITIEDVGLYRDANTDNSAGYPADITVLGSQILIQDSGQYGLNTAKAFAVVTGAGTPGPNAVLRHVVRSGLQLIYPHQRWAHGFLAEDTDAGVTYINRGTAGSGHGWAINAGVAWNVRGDVQIQSPPLGVNWGIGSSGTILADTNGTMINNGTSVTPQSLFQAQLSARKKQKG